MNSEQNEQQKPKKTLSHFSKGVREIKLMEN